MEGTRAFSEVTKRQNWLSIEAASVINVGRIGMVWDVMKIKSIGQSLITFTILLLY